MISGDLDRNGGERPSWWARSSGDVVGCGHRNSPGPGQPASLRCELAADELSLGTAAGLLDREQRGQQLLARADSTSGGREFGSIIARSSSGLMARVANSPYQDTIVRPNLAGPDRIDRFAAAREPKGWSVTD